VLCCTAGTAVLERTCEGREITCASRLAAQKPGNLATSRRCLLPYNCLRSLYMFDISNCTAKLRSSCKQRSVSATFSDSFVFITGSRKRPKYIRPGASDLGWHRHWADNDIWQWSSDGADGQTPWCMRSAAHYLPRGDLMSVHVRSRTAAPAAKSSV
jgi:hypothetical protein